MSIEKEVFVRWDRMIRIFIHMLSGERRWVFLLVRPREQELLRNQFIRYAFQIRHLKWFDNGCLKTIFLKIGHDWVCRVTA